jgi:hypothetical protein
MQTTTNKYKRRRALVTFSPTNIKKKEEQNDNSIETKRCRHDEKKISHDCMTVFKH